MRAIDERAPAPTKAGFLDLVRRNRVNDVLLQRLPDLNLPQCYLTAGCLFQTAWNWRSGLPPDAMIKDYDVFYFDADDVSWEAEDAIIRRVKATFADIDTTIEVKNQARVHLWYMQRFGHDYLALRCATEGIDRYLIECTKLGIEVATGALYAPNGLEDMWRGVLRANPLNADEKRFREKADDYRSRWPWLEIASR